MQWFRLYDDLVDDPKVQRLPPALFRDWINVLCLANRNTPRGVVPAIADVAFGLRVSEAKAKSVLKQLHVAGLLETADGVTSPHNWGKRQRVSDNVADRVAKSRARNVTSNTECNVTSNTSETLPHVRATDTETDTETEVKPPNPHPAKSTQPEPVAAAKPPDVVLDRFEQFWIAYPKRMGRDEALHAWRRIDWQKVTFEQIVEALGQHCRSLQWQKDGGQYIPRAAKWINERRWNEVLSEHAVLPKSPPNIAGIDHSATTIDEDLAALFAAEGLTQ